MVARLTSEAALRLDPHRPLKHLTAAQKIFLSLQEHARILASQRIPLGCVWIRYLRFAPAFLARNQHLVRVLNRGKRLLVCCLIQVPRRWLLEDGGGFLLRGCPRQRVGLAGNLPQIDVENVLAFPGCEQLPILAR